MSEKADIVDRLRQQGTDAFAKHYSLGMWKLCMEAADEIEKLRGIIQRRLDCDGSNGTWNARLHLDLTEEMRAAVEQMEPTL